MGQSDILSKYIEAGLENNLSIKGAGIKIKIQKSVLDQAKKLRNPSANFNGSYLLATGGRTILFPVGDLFNPTYSTLNQLTGTEQFPTDLENVETQLTPNDFFDLQINASMPLINSSIKYNQKIQQQLLALENLNKDVIKQEITLQIKMAYYNYLKSFEGIATIDESIKTLNELLNFNKVLVKYNKATRDVISDVEYQISELNSQKVGVVEQQILGRSLLNLLINRDLNHPVRIDQNIITSYDEINKEIAKMKDEAMDNRIELNQLTLAEKINDLNQKRIKRERNPQLGIFGGIGIQAERNSFKDEGLLVSTGISVSMKIYDGGLSNKQIEQLKYEKERISNNRAQLDQQIELEITQLYYQIKTIESRIASQLLGMASARESFDIQKVKYENDKILLIELLRAENRLTTSKINLDLLKYDHLIKMAELDKAIEVNFK